MPQLVIAAGTPDEIGVYDVRAHRDWAGSWTPRPNSPHDEIFWHHTVTTYAGGLSWLLQYEHLIEIERDAPHGLPYNLVLFDVPPFIPWYVNDLDLALPHTGGHNDDVAIAAIGNYDIDTPSVGLVGAMFKTSRAIWRLWHPLLEGQQPRIRGHRDVFPTACPGRYLYAHIPR